MIQNRVFTWLPDRLSPGAACATAAVRLENRHVSTSGGNVGFLTLEKMTEEIRFKKKYVFWFNRNLPSLKLTAKAPENRPGNKGKLGFRPSIFRCELLVLEGGIHFNPSKRKYWSRILAGICFFWNWLLKYPPWNQEKKPLTIDAWKMKHSFGMGPTSRVYVSIQYLGRVHEGYPTKTVCRVPLKIVESIPTIGTRSSGGRIIWHQDPNNARV